MISPWVASAAPPVADRQQAVSEVSRSLTSAYLFGSVIVGKPGVGKSNLLHEVLDGTESIGRVIYLRGTALSSGKPLNALAFLLKEFGLSAEQEPQMLVEALAHHLGNVPNQGTVVIAVDNADSLDAVSADVIAQLALNLSVKLLIACRDLTDCPSSLMTLWLEGALLRIDLNELSQSEAHELLAQTLKGPLSRSAVHALWGYAAGNARLMKLLVHDFVSCGKILRQGDVWVLGRAHMQVSHPTADAVMAHLGPLTAQQAELLETLALAGHLSMGMVSALGSVQDLDHLQDIGAIHLARDTSQLVVTDHLVAVVIRERVGSFRRLQLLTRVRQLQAKSTVPAIHPVRYAEWMMECGLSLDEESGLRALAYANDHDDPTSALMVAAGLGEHGSTHPALRLETARAHLAADDEGSAVEAMEMFVVAARDCLSAEDERRLRKPEHRSVRVQIEVARSILAGHGCAPGRAPSPAFVDVSGNDEILLAQAERAASEGRYELIRPMLDGKQGEPGAPVSEIGIQLTCLLALADAIRDRQQEALALAAEVTAGLQHLRLAHRIRARLMFRVQLICLITGQKADAGWTGITPELHLTSGDGTAGEFMDGISLARLGRPGEALAALVPALAQLQVWDPGGLRCVCSAATAFCHALQGDFGKVRPLMLPLEDSERVTPAGLPLFTLRYFRAMTLALLGSSDQAVSMLEEQAGEEFSAGNFGLELIARAAALRLGTKSTARALLETASRTQGPFSDFCSFFGEGLTMKKPELLLEAVHMAEDLGNHLFAAKVRESARSMAVASGDRNVTRQVQRVIVNSGLQLNDADADEQLNLLTPREREAAQLVKSGLINRQIAQQMHVSVRTVEGYLYQIYVKLGVSNRADLIAALEGEAS